MASYPVASGDVGAHAKTLSAGVVDTVTFQIGSPGTPGWSAVPGAVEVLSDGLADIYVTVNGSTPTVAGANTYRISAAHQAVTISVADSNSQDDVVVKLISAGAPTYSVSRAG